MKNLKIRDFVEWELQKFRDECNFTEDELAVFELKAKNKSMTQIAYELNISEPQVSKLTKRVMNKIIKVI